MSIADSAVRVLADRFSYSDTARFSPDGRFVTYSRDDPRGHDIFVVTLDRVSTPLVEGPTDDRNPVWSPDGSHIVFVSDRTGNRSVWMIPVAAGRPSGPARLLKENIRSVVLLGFTRSGALYYTAGSPGTNVYTVELNANMNAAAAPSMAVNQYVNSNSNGSWSPDGQW